MKNFVSAVLAGAMLFASVHVSMAVESEGVVASIDTETRTVLLEDGTRWLTADDVDLTALEPGDMVQVTVADGTTVITSIEKVEM
jgi:hypothetical protein